MKNEVTTLRGKHLIYFYEYPTGNRPYGGGWSRQAKRKPAPILTIRETLNPRLQGKSVHFDGIRKLKCTIVRKADGTIIREDYPLQRITQELLTRQSTTPLDPNEPPIARIAIPYGQSHRKINPC
jgi:hypothetical protein